MGKETISRLIQVIKQEKTLSNEILEEKRKEYLAQQKKKKQEQKKEKVKQFFHNLAVNIVHYLILGIIGLVILGYYIFWAMAVIGNAVGPLDDSVLTAPFRK